MNAAHQVTTSTRHAVRCVVGKCNPYLPDKVEIPLGLDGIEADYVAQHRHALAAHTCTCDHGEALHAIVGLGPDSKRGETCRRGACSVWLCGCKTYQARGIA